MASEGVTQLRFLTRCVPPWAGVARAALQGSTIATMGRKRKTEPGEPPTDDSIRQRYNYARGHKEALRTVEKFADDVVGWIKDYQELWEACEAKKPLDEGTAKRLVTAFVTLVARLLGGTKLYPDSQDKKQRNKTVDGYAQKIQKVMEELGEKFYPETGAIRDKDYPQQEFITHKWSPEVVELNLEAKRVYNKIVRCVKEGLPSLPVEFPRNVELLAEKPSSLGVCKSPRDGQHAEYAPIDATIARRKRPKLHRDRSGGGLAARSGLNLADAGSVASTDSVQANGSMMAESTAPYDFGRIDRNEMLGDDMLGAPWHATSPDDDSLDNQDLGSPSLPPSLSHYLNPEHDAGPGGGLNGADKGPRGAVSDAAMHG